MKFTLVLAQGSSRHQGVGRRDRPTSCRRSGSRSRASTIRPPSSARSRVARIVEAKQHPNADKLQVVQVETGRARRCSRSCAARPTRATGMIGVFAPLGSYIPGIEDHAREEAGARRRLERHDVLGGRARALRRAATASSSCRPSMASDVGERYVDVHGPRRSGDRGEADAEPARLHRRARHRARSRRRRPRHAEAGAEASTASKAASSARSTSSSSSRARRADACPVFAGRYIRASRTARRRPGCSSASRPSACGRSTRWST